ncbi:MAG: helix-turn-helix domain-containing protein [Oscillospiraceae bacterium]|nr:helix-turn-helix domain-containing protein [Oscillospiraceae bacterium]
MEQIRIARRGRGWTQEQLAEAIGVKRSVISKYENGAISPSIDTIQRIAEALGADISYLLSGESSVAKTHLAEGVHIYKSAVPYQAGSAFWHDSLCSSCEIYFQDDYLLIAIENDSDVTDEELRKIVSAYAPYRKQQDYLQGKGGKYRIEAAIAQMNETGQSKVADYAEDILPRYRAETAPEPPLTPSEGTDTTPPPDAPETPPEGK